MFMTTTVTLDADDQRLRELVKRARSGEDIVIADAEGPLARLVAVTGLPRLEPRQPGALKGLIDLPDAFFFDPLPADELDAWWSDGPASK